MKKQIFIFVSLFFFFKVNAEENLRFYLTKALENNILLNAERKSLESSKQKKIFQEANFIQA